MNEGPKRPELRIVGGTDYEESAEKKSPREILQGEVSDSELVGLYMELKKNRPADLEARAKGNLVAQMAARLRTWTKNELYAYLSMDSIWNKPSQTLAVFEEIRTRMEEGSLAPRG